METGKHFKEEDRLREMMEPETIELSADVMPDAWYKARIKQLEGEYMRLNQEIQALEDKEEKLLENQQILVQPIVRNGKKATVGYQPDIWKSWD